MSFPEISSFSVYFTVISTRVPESETWRRVENSTEVGWCTKSYGRNTTPEDVHIVMDSEESNILEVQVYRRTEEL